MRRGAFEESTTEHRVAPIDSKPHPEIDGIPECVAETGDDGLLTLYEASKHAAMQLRLTVVLTKRQSAFNICTCMYIHAAPNTNHQ